MEDNKNAEKSFLDKFKGKANRVDKNGLNHALSPKLPAESHKIDLSPTNKRVKLASLDHNPQLPSPRASVDMDQLIFNDPNSRVSHLSKRSMNTKLTPKKLESLYDPQKLSSMSTSQHQGLRLPPSRPISDKSENLSRRVFGKYLKLDDEAKRHLQFLQQINKGRPGKVSNQVQ